MPAKIWTMPLERRGPGTPHAQVADVAAALADWTRGSGPMLARLASALEAAVLRGTIAAGTRLPSERDLAQRLGISRSTVVAAYDRLKTEGRAHTQRGSGTYAGPPGPLERSGRFSPGHLVSIVDNRDGPRQSVEFTIAALPGSRELGPATERLAKQLQKLSRETPGYVPLGLPALRREIARGYTERGLPTEPEQIIVTSGAQQAIALVAQLFRGERVAMEDPTNPASLDAFRAAGADIVPIGVDDDGIIVEELERLPAARMPAGIYAATTYNNPTGTVLSPTRRRRLAENAQREGWVIIEDETLCDITMEDVEPPLPIAAYGTGATVLTIGSACKLFWGGLRIGWVRGEAHMISRIAPLKIVADLGTSLVGQALCAELLPLRDRVRAERRAQLAVRYRTLVGALERDLPSWSLYEPRGGSSLWINLPYGDSMSFAVEAARFGVTVAPGPVFSSAERHARRLRLPFVLDPDVLLTGVERLAAAWSAYAPRAATLPHDAVV